MFKSGGVIINASWILYGCQFFLGSCNSHAEDGLHLKKPERGKPFTPKNLLEGWRRNRQQKKPSKKKNTDFLRQDDKYSSPEERLWRESLLTLVCEVASYLRLLSSPSNVTSHLCRWYHVPASISMGLRRNPYGLYGSHVVIWVLYGLLRLVMLAWNRRHQFCPPRSK